MTVEIRSAKIARAAYGCIAARIGSSRSARKEYLSFARAFPTMIHVSGLAQAGAFARSKAEEKLNVLDDLAEVVGAIHPTWVGENNLQITISDGASLDELARSTASPEYMRLTLVGLQAATWLKRYAEALLGEPNAVVPSPEETADGQ